MNVRRAGEGDLGVMRELWRAFTDEATFTPYPGADFSDALVRDQLAYLAEEDEQVLGTAYANLSSPHFGYVFGVYVRPEARRRGIAKALLAAIAAELEAQGREHLVLDVDTPNAGARAAYERLGFTEIGRRLATRVADLRERAARAEAPPSFGSIHVQSDDERAVERAVRQFVPRLPGRSRGSIVAAARNGWIAVYDDVCDRDPRQLRRLAREISDRMGAVVLAFGVEEGAVVRFILFDRGGIVDEYLSVQEYYGPLPPGEVVALAANPRVVARLTGADPAAVRAAAVHASTPADLPPPMDVLAGLARVIGIEGAEHGYADAPEIPGATRIER